MLNDKKKTAEIALPNSGLYLSAQWKGCFRSVESRELTGEHRIIFFSDIIYED